MINEKSYIYIKTPTGRVSLVGTIERKGDAFICINALKENTTTENVSYFLSDKKL